MRETRVAKDTAVVAYGSGENFPKAVHVPFWAKKASPAVQVAQFVNWCQDHMLDLEQKLAQLETGVNHLFRWSCSRRPRITDTTARVTSVIGR
jgi:hypothetical protein